jgi:hypothetical protein
LLKDEHKPSLSKMVSSMSKPKKTEHHEIVKRLYDLNHSKDQLANTILALMVSTVELSVGAISIVLQKNM